MSEPKYLLDLNVLIALGDTDHEHHDAALRWFNNNEDATWGTCPFTEAGFIRVIANSRARGYSLSEANDLLDLLIEHPRHQFWPIEQGWRSLSAPFADRLFGHQQVTDACLLGLAIHEHGVLITFDKAIARLAGAKFEKSLVLLDNN